MILNDKQIRKQIKITFPEPDLKEGFSGISKGYSSFGYDVTLGPLIERFTNGLVDPKNFKKGNQIFLQRILLEYTKTFNKDNVPDFVTLMPQSFYLAHSLEHFEMPDDVLGVCVGKSTYARSGLIIPATPLEPGWKGQLTLEIHNPTPCKVRLYLYEGIMQINFFKGKRPKVTYSDKKGKYQDQKGIVYPKGFSLDINSSANQIEISVGHDKIVSI